MPQEKVKMTEVRSERRKEEEEEEEAKSGKHQTSVCGVYRTDRIRSSSPREQKLSWGTSNQKDPQLWHRSGIARREWLYPQG